MPRLNQERQQKLEPVRLDIAKKQIQDLGLEIKFECETRIDFLFKGNIIQYYPYSGWASGKGIVAGRGLNNLLKQLKTNKYVK